MENKKYCTNCGKIVDINNERFCKNCGKMINNNLENFENKNEVNKTNNENNGVGSKIVSIILFIISLINLIVFPMVFILSGILSTTILITGGGTSLFYLLIGYFVISIESVIVFYINLFKNKKNILKSILIIVCTFFGSIFLAKIIFLILNYFRI